MEPMTTRRPLVPSLLGSLLTITLAAPLGEADTPTAAPLVAISFGAGDPSAVLVPGEVKLHGRDADAFLHLCRAAFDAPIPQQLETGLRTQLVADFKARGILGRQAWLKLLDPWPQIAADQKAGRADSVREGLQSFRVALDKRLRAFPDARVHQLVGRLLKRQSEILMPGPPEVTGLAADVYLDALVFVASLGRNEALRLTDGQRSVLSDHIREQFKSKPSGDHRAVRELATAWNRVQRSWDTADPATQLRTRLKAVQLVARLALKGKGENVPDSTGAAALTAHAQRVREAGGKLDALSSLSVNPTHVWAVLRDGLGLKDATAKDG